MEIKNIYQRILFWSFCISMILFFVTGAIYPVETNYWIVSNGIPIFIIEFISIFSIMFLLVITNKKAEEKLNIQVSDVISSRISKKTSFMVALICIFLMAFFFLFLYSIWIFIYFLASHTIKYYAFKQISTAEETNKAINAWGGATVSVILSALISFALSGFTRSIFSEQISLMNEYHREILTNAGATGFASFEFFILWGIIYFIMIIFFDWLAPVWEEKTGKPFIRTYY